MSSDSESDAEVDLTPGLAISKEAADLNYQLAGVDVDEPPDQIDIENHKHLLNDNVHHLIMEVLEDSKLRFKLADFQLLSLHVLGSKRNLILISPTGSGNPQL